MPIEGSDAYVAGWKRVASTARFVVPSAAGLAYPIVYFGSSFALRGTALGKWLWETEPGFGLRAVAFVLMWVWIGFAPGIARRTFVRREMRRRRRATMPRVRDGARVG